MARLDPDEREAIVGRLEFGCSYRELAEAWGKPSADAARKAVERAIERLATLLQRRTPTTCSSDSRQQRPTDSP